MPTFRWSELKTEPVDGAYSPAAGPVVRGRQIEAYRVVYPAGAEVKRHASPLEQVHSVLRGSARYRVGTEEKAVGPAEAVLIRPNTDYSVHVLEEYEVVVFKELTPGPAAGPRPADATAFYKWEDMKSDFITPKYSSGRGPTITGDRIEVAYMFYPAGTEGKPHQHPNEQIQILLRGKVRPMIAGQEMVMGAGEGVLFPSDTLHGLKIDEDYTTVNCKNIVPGFSVYNAAWEDKK